MRLFVAVDVPDRLQEAIESEIVQPLRGHLPGARWTRPGGRHLTLKFLGNVGDERVDAIRAALRETTQRHAPFDASFAEIGGFPNLGRPRVLWIGVGTGAQHLAALAGTVEAAMTPLGFEPEDRPFRGHLTLARFPQPTGIVLPEVSVDPEPFPVRQVTLFQSRLHPKGARYTVVDHFALRG